MRDCPCRLRVHYLRNPPPQARAITCGQACSANTALRKGAGPSRKQGSKVPLAQTFREDAGLRCKAA
eukprot:8574686-Alexandrium_andersonii.AAC.1